MNPVATHHQIPLFGPETVAPDNIGQSYAARAAGRDICQNRHRGNPESRAAHQRLRKSGRLSADARCIYALILKAGHRGLTPKEAAAVMGKKIHQISGRFTELKRLRLIEPVKDRTDAVRDGSRACRVADNS